jgi:hypothetical protein
MSDLAQEIEDAKYFTVSGLIVNDPNGPRRWYEAIEATTCEAAEDIARTMVHMQRSEGRYGVLLVANVFAGRHKPVDTYATYGDDPHRAEGYRPARGWTPPSGFEGLER